MPKRLTNKRVAYLIKYAILLAMLTGVVFCSLIADQLLKHKENGALTWLFNPEFLQYIENHSNLRKSVIAFMIIAAILLSTFLLSSFDGKTEHIVSEMYNLRINKNNEFNKHSKCSLFSKPVMIEEQEDFKTKSCRTTFKLLVSTVINIISISFLMGILLNVFQHYTNKSITNYNTIPDSILNNKVAMSFLSVVVTLIIITLIWNTVVETFNFVKADQFYKHSERQNTVAEDSSYFVLPSSGDLMLHVLSKIPRVNNFLFGEVIEKPEKFSETHRKHTGYYRDRHLRLCKLIEKPEKFSGNEQKY